MDREQGSVPHPRRSWKIRDEIRARRVNEKLETLVESADPDPDRAWLDVVCECSDETCRDRVRVPLPRYSTIHTRRDDFIIRPGHEALDVERIVESEPGFLVVRKKDLPAN